MEKSNDDDFEFMDVRSETDGEEEDDDDIVITGISGVFPGSRNLEELELNLRIKLNLISGTYVDVVRIVCHVPRPTDTWYLLVVESLDIKLYSTPSSTRYSFLDLFVMRGFPF